MRSSGTPLIVAFVLLLAGLGAWYFLGTKDPAVDPLPVAASQAPAETQPLALQAAGATAREATGEPARPRTALERTERGDLDAEFSKLMAGFRGRVVTGKGQAAAQCKVKLYRGDPEMVLADLALVAEGGVNEPKVDAGEATTDEEGRFEILGTWPRSFHLLMADAGGENPTPRVVEQIPGPGEIVDLGDIALRDGAVVTGLVVDRDGNPLAGALVRALDIPGALVGPVPIDRFDPSGALVVREGSKTLVMQMPPYAKRLWDELPIPRTLSGTDGRFRLTGVPEGTVMFAVNARDHATYLQPALKLKAGQTRDLGTVRMREGETIVGRVVDTEGKPVAGAEVMVGPRSMMIPVDFMIPVGRSDADGRFQMLGFPSGQVSGIARRDGEAWTVTEPKPTAGELVIQLPSTHTLTLTVRAKGGAKVGDLRLSLVQSDDESRGGAAVFGVGTPIAIDARRKTLDDGRIQIERLVPAFYVVRCRAAGFVPEDVVVRVDKDTTKEIELDPERRIQLTVVRAPSGKPGARAAVYVEGGVGDGMPVRAGTTDAAGQLLLPIDPSRTRTDVSASHPAFGVYHGKVDAKTEALTITMSEPGSVEGVLTEDGREPTPGKWTVAVSPRGGMQNGAIPVLPALATPDAKGRFRLTGLRPGSYRAEVIESLKVLTSFSSLMSFGRASYFMSDRQRVEFEIRSGEIASVQLDATKRMEAAPDKGARLFGTATINGAPAQGFVLTGWADRRVVAQVDAAGRFDCGIVAAGSHHFQLQDANEREPWGSSLWSRNVEIKVGEDQELEIAIVTGAASGTVWLPDGTPGRGMMVSASGSQPPRDPKDPKAQARQSFVNLRTQTDENGRFEFQRLPVGAYSFSAHGESARGNSGGVTIEAGGIASVEIKVARTFRVRGKVDMTALGGKRKGWVNLNWTRTESGSRHSQGAGLRDDGTFDMQGLAAGTYEVELRVWEEVVQESGGSRWKESDTYWKHDGTFLIRDKDLDDVLIVPRVAENPRKPPR
ncbi:MAG: hypothetical protein IT458_13500 [Planctomycetes bacterium]|nr:hypothetical protein [Planctomycetota bacterium]